MIAEALPSADGLESPGSGTPTPKATRVLTRLAQLVSELRVGDAIPPERALAVELGVSRMTVRSAVQLLVDAGYLERHQGRGTFVTRPKIMKSVTMTSFSEDMRRRGLQPSSQTLSLERGPAGPKAGWRLELSPADTVVRIRRLRRADGEPMALEHLVVSDSLVPGLKADDLEDASFYELLRTRYEITLGGGVQSIEPTVTDAEESDLLEVPLHSPAFLFERVSRDSGGNIVELGRSLYRGDRYRFVVDLVPDAVPELNRLAEGSGSP